MLTKNQFNTLVLLEKEKDFLTQREISKKINISLGTVNKVLQELKELDFIIKGKLNEKGFNKLEEYKVKRAIFIAAGFGSRLVPITLSVPKPLVKVRGKVMIETLLDALIETGIEEIYIVRGYLKEQFDALLFKYPHIKFIDNNYYNEANNIGSAYMARELIGNSYILEADLFLTNKNLLTKYQYNSNYLGIKVDKTDDWCFFEEGGTIKGVSIGGQNTYQMIGISYWTKEDGLKLVKDIEEVYLSPGGKERYWDEVPLKYRLSHYNVSIRECVKEDIIEIDSYSELKDFDTSYK